MCIAPLVTAEGRCQWAATWAGNLDVAQAATLKRQCLRQWLCYATRFRGLLLEASGSRRLSPGQLAKQLLYSGIVRVLGLPEGCLHYPTAPQEAQAERCRLGSESSIVRCALDAGLAPAAEQLSSRCGRSLIACSLEFAGRGRGRGSRRRLGSFTASPTSFRHFESSDHLERASRKSKPMVHSA